MRCLRSEDWRVNRKQMPGKEALPVEPIGMEAPETNREIYVRSSVFSPGKKIERSHGGMQGELVDSWHA